MAAQTLQFTVRLNSTNLASASYDVWSETLEIHFRNGSAYQYEAVPPGIFDALIAAESPGRFHHRHIKDRYHCRRIK